MSTKLLLGDCLKRMQDLPDCSIDSIVTDPPYGISFMGKRWDYDVPSVEIWEQCLRVLKPGGHLLAFAGTRTQHRMAVRIEDAGFEIRDMIAWVYGSGFPKSLDVSKAIDKAAGATRETGPIDPVRAGRLANQSGNYETEAGWSAGNRKVTIDPPATPEAKQWQGWGTALKPALEPITVARKPLIGTVTENVLTHGTGGVNIDACRVATDELKGKVYNNKGDALSWGGTYGKGVAYGNEQGRWPANLIHDGSDEVTGVFPQAKGQQGAVSGKEPSGKTHTVYGQYQQRNKSTPRNDSGSAARFFYCAKANKKDRGKENTHPTVKPTDLMRYLCRLVTPPNGIVLDPFMGSGSTAIAAIRENFNFVGIEMLREHFETAKRRIIDERRKTKP